MIQLAPESLSREAIARALRQARYLAGLSQQKLGDLSGIKQSDISRAENANRDPTAEELERIADALCCDVPQLYELAARHQERV